MAMIVIYGRAVGVPELCPATRREARALATRALQMGVSDFLADEDLRKFAGCPEVLRELERQGAVVSLSLTTPGEDLSATRSNEGQGPVLAHGLDVSPSPAGGAAIQREARDASAPAVRLGSDVPPEDAAATDERDGREAGRSDTRAPPYLTRQS